MLKSKPVINTNGRMCVYVTQNEIKLLEVAIRVKMEELNDANDILKGIPNPACAYVQSTLMDYEDLLKKLSETTGKGR